MLCLLYKPAVGILLLTYLEAVVYTNRMKVDYPKSAYVYNDSEFILRLITVVKQFTLATNSSPSVRSKQHAFLRYFINTFRISGICYQ